MELFVVRNVKSQEVSEGFNNKMEAKKLRRDKNPKDEHGNEIFDHVVSPGKDHPDYGKITKVIYRGKKK